MSRPNVSANVRVDSRFESQTVPPDRNPALRAAAV
jgi:hypothetical protein